MYVQFIEILVSCMFSLLIYSQAAVRALDTMASFAREKNSEINLTKFVVAGASKVKYN